RTTVTTVTSRPTARFRARARRTALGPGLADVTMLPRVPAPRRSVTALMITPPAATVPKSFGGRMAASTISDVNHETWLRTWPVIVHATARATALFVGCTSAPTSSRAISGAVDGGAATPPSWRTH